MIFYSQWKFPLLFKERARERIIVKNPLILTFSQREKEHSVCISIPTKVCF